MTAVVAHDALGLTGGARGVEDIQGIRRGHGHATGRRGGTNGAVPVHVATFQQFRHRLRTLLHHAGRHLVLRHVDGGIQQGLVLDDTIGLDATGGRQDGLRLGVVDPGRQFVGGEAAEHHGVDRTDAGAGQHGDGRFGNHRHVDDDPVALFHTGVGEHACQASHHVGELAVAVGALLPGHRAVVDQRSLFTATCLHVPIQRVVTGIDGSTGEPAGHRAGVAVEHAVPRGIPVKLFSGIAPERLRVRDGSFVDFFVGSHPFLLVIDALPGISVSGFVAADR